MFDEILDYLLTEDTSGYPIPDNLDYPGYTLEAEVEEMLYNALSKANKSMKEFIMNLIDRLSLGNITWQEMIETMQEIS